MGYTGNRTIAGTAVEGAKPLYEVVFEKPDGEIRHVSYRRVDGLPLVLIELKNPADEQAEHVEAGRLGKGRGLPGRRGRQRHEVSATLS